MRHVGKGVAWLSIVSTLLMACTTTSLVAPTASNKERVCTGEIQYVVRKDSTKFWFDRPPAIINDTIVGEAVFYRNRVRMRDSVAISLSDVTMASLDESDPTRTILLGVGVIGIIVALVVATWHDADTTMEFPLPPTYGIY
jgi:hypothetical protein